MSLTKEQVVKGGYGDMDLTAYGEPIPASKLRYERKPHINKRVLREQAEAMQVDTDSEENCESHADPDSFQYFLVEGVPIVLYRRLDFNKWTAEVDGIYWQGSTAIEALTKVKDWLNATSGRKAGSKPYDTKTLLIRS